MIDQKGLEVLLNDLFFVPFKKAPNPLLSKRLLFLLHLPMTRTEKTPFRE